jgi:hypothetical protein
MINSLARLFAAFVLTYFSAHLLAWRSHGYNVGPEKCFAAVGSMPVRCIAIREKR